MGLADGGTLKTFLSTEETAKHYSGHGTEMDAKWTTCRRHLFFFPFFLLSQLTNRTGFDDGEAPYCLIDIVHL